jgi:hypothetical protein
MIVKGHHNSQRGADLIGAKIMVMAFKIVIVLMVLMASMTMMIMVVLIVHRSAGSCKMHSQAT